MHKTDSRQRLVKIILIFIMYYHSLVAKESLIRTRTTLYIVKTHTMILFLPLKANKLIKKYGRDTLRSTVPLGVSEEREQGHVNPAALKYRKTVYDSP